MAGELIYPGEMIYINERDPDTGMPLRQGVAFRHRVNRASPKQVNRLADQARTREGRATTAAGSLLPLVYGRVRIAPPRGGHVYARGTLAGDLVLGISWCLGTVNAIEAVQINDAAVPGGITLTQYTGDPAQGVDPTLAAAITDYDDSLVISASGEQWGVTHTVARIQAGVLDGWPRFAAIIQGRRVYDPRDAGQDPDDPSTWLYSANPALCAADQLTSRAYGMGRRVLGLADAADWCDDEVQAGESRMSIGLALWEPRPAWEYVQLLLRYAQCWYAWEGDALRLIPDQPVAVPVATITGADIEGGSLDVRPRDISRAPNLVEVRYTVPSDDPVPWGETVATSRAAGVDAGDVLPVPLTLRLPGIHRPGEASRVAQQELIRPRIPAEYAWAMYSDGLLFQPGDRVRLLLSERNIDRAVRITGVDRIDGGRYQISGEHYGDELYSDLTGDPDEPLPAGFEIPDGLIVIWDSADPAPAGWTVYGTADGRWILGAGGSINPGDTGGGGSVTVSGITATAGAHDHSPTTATYGSTGAFGAGPVTAVSTNPTAGAHGHSYASGSATPKARHWSRRLIQRSGGVTTDPLPQHVAMLALELLANPSIALASPTGQPLLRADSANGQDTSNSVAVSGGTTGAGGDHWHVGSSANRATTVGPGLVVLGQAGSHAHTYGGLTLTSDPARVRCGLYKGASGAYNYISGMIGFWGGSLASIPAGWELVADLTDKLIELHDTSLGSASGNDTATWTGVTSTAGDHSHHADTQSGDNSIAAGHASTKGAHGHQIFGSASWRPEWFALAAIRYVGT